MGEVYRATDGALHRDVALKVLPAELISDQSRFLRFEQEARATAALRHPNIVTIHDFGTSDSISYLVTELLEGESLADVLERGPVPLRRSLAWALHSSRTPAPYAFGSRSKILWAENPSDKLDAILVETPPLLLGVGEIDCAGGNPKPTRDLCSSAKVITKMAAGGFLFHDDG
jgi:hypothetical protein